MWQQMRLNLGYWDTVMRKFPFNDAYLNNIDIVYEYLTHIYEMIVGKKNIPFFAAN